MMLNSSSNVGVGVVVDLVIRPIVHAGGEGMKMSQGCSDEMRTTMMMKKKTMAVVVVPECCWCCLRQGAKGGLTCELHFLAD